MESEIWKNKWTISRSWGFANCTSLENGLEILLPLTAMTQALFHLVLYLRSFDLIWYFLLCRSRGDSNVSTASHSKHTVHWVLVQVSKSGQEVILGMWRVWRLTWLSTEPMYVKMFFSDFAIFLCLQKPLAHHLEKFSRDSGRKLYKSLNTRVLFSQQDQTSEEK